MLSLRQQDGWQTEVAQRGTVKDGGGGCARNQATCLVRELAAKLDISADISYPK